MAFILSLLFFVIFFLILFTIYYIILFRSKTFACDGDANVDVAVEVVVNVWKRYMIVTIVHTDFIFQNHW